MKATFFLLLCTLTACQSWQARAPEQKYPAPHRGVGTGAGSSGAAGSGTASGTHDAAAGMGDRYEMCKLNQRIRSARTPEERQAIVEQAMPDMPQDSRERHLRMMQQSCH
jgi:hypothetical protein